MPHVFCMQGEDTSAAVIVRVRGGLWPPLALTREDSGLPGRPVLWVGEPAESGGPNPVISAAADVPGTAFKQWADRPGVWVADLKALGITRYGNLTTVRARSHL